MSKTDPKDAKKVFRKLGTCSRTFSFLLNREFGASKEIEECAADSLAGGIMQQGQQCGMLWGSALAVGAEAYRQCKDLNQAMQVAIIATQHVMNSFSKRENTINCREITHCDFSSKLSFVKYFFSGRFFYCFKLAEQWAPDAIKSAIDGLSSHPDSPPEGSINCASEIARKMGASDEEMVMVAGFAGGLGLSGGGCGALSAAIWMKSIEWCKENGEKSSFKNPNATWVLKSFQEMFGSKILCSEISGQEFNTRKDHSDFIENGGCQKLMSVLSQT